MSGDQHSVEYAGFWRRFAAHLVDQLLLGVVLGALFSLIAARLGVLHEFLPPAGVDRPISEAAFGFILSWSCFEILATLLYYALFESSVRQATPGKMLLGVRVCDLQGGRIGLVRAIGRYLGKILSGALLLIGYLMQPFTKRRQALHDLLAGTLVVKGEAEAGS